MFCQIEEDASTNLAGSADDLPGNIHDDEQKNIPEHGNMLWNFCILCLLR
jgi:hypothetical protein